MNATRWMIVTVAEGNKFRAYIYLNGVEMMQTALYDTFNAATNAALTLTKHGI